jgi:hypothetical protein
VIKGDVSAESEHCYVAVQRRTSLSGKREMYQRNQSTAT